MGRPKEDSHLQEGSQTQLVAWTMLESVAQIAIKMMLFTMGCIPLKALLSI